MFQVKLRTQRRTWADCFGFVFFVSFIIFSLVRNPQVGALFLPTNIHNGLIAASFMLRGQHKAKIDRLRPRLVAYLGTFVVPVFTTVALTYRSDWLQTSQSTALLKVGMLAWGLGVICELLALWYLRHAFSIEPDARELITEGPYRYARHPIYTGYLLQYAGVALTHPSEAFRLALLAWLVLTVMRVRYEEEVLTLAFPSYAEYRERVSMFGPLTGCLRFMRKRHSASAGGQLGYHQAQSDD